MSKRVVVVSSYVDDLIEEQQPDVTFYIFQSINDLSRYVDNTPIRAEEMYITMDVLQPSVNTSLNFLLSLFTPFLHVDRIEYLTEKGHSDVASVNYLIEVESLKNWHVIQGNSLTREWVMGIITGALRAEEILPTRKVVYRVRRSDYVQEALRNKTTLEEDFPSDEDRLSDIPDEEVPIVPISDVEKLCEIITVTGLKCIERTVFSFVLAQYLSFNGKTLIMENDFDYLTLSDVATKSKVEFLQIDIEQIYENFESVIRTVKSCGERLIVITASRRQSINYQFVSNLIYNSLSAVLSYFVTELETTEVASTAKYITVIPNNIVDIIKTVEVLPDSYRNNSSYVGVAISKINELNIGNSEVVKTLLEDLLQVGREIKLNILNITSLKIGGEAHDLRLLIDNQQ
jgi:hypothetical protein